MLLLITPGAVVAVAARLPVPIALAVGPALTYGVVGAATIPYDAVGIPWNVWTALFATAVIGIVAAGLRKVLSRFADRDAERLAVTWRPAAVVAGGVVLGALLIGVAAVSGMPHWQSIPSNWDSVWHANTIRFILETGQASSTHMGELRNVETRDALYYPSVFHALAAVLSQVTGAAPTTAYTLSSVAASVWLFPTSAAILTWLIQRPYATVERTAGCAAAAAALSASFTAIPYVEFDTASMANLAAYGVAVPTAALVISAVRVRDRIPLAVLALIGVFSVHTTGGAIVVILVAGWWAFDALWRPVRGRLKDFAVLAVTGVVALAALLPQFLGILALAEIIVGHAFVTGEGRKRALARALLQHTRHLNDFPIQWVLLVLAAVGAVMLLRKRIWWPLAVWLLLVAATLHSAAPFGTIVGALVGKFADLFYSDPRRISAVIAMVLAPLAGIALFTLASWVGGRLRRAVPRPVPAMATAIVLAAVVAVGCAWHYFPRNRYLLGQKYDSVMINQKDLDAFAYLANLPGARDTLIGNANVDGTAWMYAVAGLRPLWTHYDYPQQQGPGDNRFIIWARADQADFDPTVGEAVRKLDIRYVLTSTPVVGGFVMPDGLVSLEQSRSWAKIYDNGEARIYEWRGQTS